MKKLCLIIIFNHRYDDNIKILRKMYAERFHNIFFLVPFYEGTEENVIAIYENSYQFQGYISQAFNKIYCPDYSHYVFIGDDLILNPKINEENLCEILGLQGNDAYIESISPLNQMSNWTFGRFHDTELAFRQKGASYKNEIPSYESASELLRKYIGNDFSLKDIKYSDISMKDKIKHKMMVLMKPFSLNYPLGAAYSDFFVVPGESIFRFSRLCGVFAAMRLFVEIAIPTAMAFTCQTIKMQKDAAMKTERMWLPSDIVNKFEKECDFKIENMDVNWPEGYLYLHPVKLSKWKQ